MRGFLRMVAGLVMVLLVGGCSGEQTTSTPQGSAAMAQTPLPQSGADPRVVADGLPLLPDSVRYARNPPQVIRASYRFAAEHPEVLNFVPCFCGCERAGHRGSHDCFVASRDPKGRVTAWDTHGIECDICLDVAFSAMQMHNGGASVSAIRAAIDKKYKADGHGHGGTPTPMPKSSGGTHD